MAQVALQHLVTLAARVPTLPSTSRGAGLSAPKLFEDVGRLEWREGRDLDLLLAAYRAGGRVTWRHVSLAAIERGLPPEAVATLAEAVFLFIEELSSASARGYVEEQRATAAERERLRAQLAELLISGRSDRSVTRSVALRAGWQVPTLAAVALVDPSDESALALLGHLDGSCLPLRTGLLAGAVVADPDAPGRRAALTAALAGSSAVIGSTVPLSELPATVRVTEDALRLRLAGLLGGASTREPLFVADHYDTVIVARDPWLLSRLREQVLAPLSSLPAATRVRLEETLGAWLASSGDRRLTAARLRVHPQTVRYRLRQLTDCFGPALDDPELRLRLMLALCWTRDGSSAGAGAGGGGGSRT